MYYVLQLCILPHDMEYDVSDKEIMSSVAPSSDISNDNCRNIKDTPNVSNKRKRQRVDSTIPAMSVDISDLSRRLADHVPLDKNKFGILSFLADIDSTIPEFSFKVKNVNKSKSKLYFSDPKVHTSMMAILRTKNIHSYSFTPKEPKQ